VAASDVNENDITDMTNQGGKIFGWEFTLQSDVIVTHLGVFDDAFMGSSYPTGFITDYQIGIFRKSDPTDPCAFADLSDGIPATYVGCYGYVPPTQTQPITLTKEVSYIVACYTKELPSTEPMDYHIRQIELGTVPVNYPVNFVQCYSQWYNVATGFVMPTNPSGDALFTPNFLFKPAATHVDVDIWPGTDFDCIDLRYNYLVPVAILSKGTFDVTTVDPTTIDLSGAPVAAWNGILMYAIFDVDCDGHNDLVFLVKSKKIKPNLIVDGYAILKAETDDDQALEGKDHVTIIK
jgi:hypothetical protein